MRRSIVSGLVVALAAVIGVPASAQEVPTFRTERAYFTCIEPHKLQNISMLDGQMPSWNTTAPGPASAGNGCGMYENALTQTGLNLDIQGTFTGNLDNLTVELHNLGVSQQYPNDTMQMIATLTIDDEPLADTGSTVFPMTVGVGPGHKVTYTFTELNYDDELGDGSQVHTIFIQARSSGVDTNSLWVWGAAEVPSGITFNPATIEGKTIPVNRP